MSDIDLDALSMVLEMMGNEGFDDDPGGEAEWIEALSAWCVDMHGERLNDAKLAERLSTIWQIGNLVETELKGRFQIRATHRANYPYRGLDGELKGGIVDSYKLSLLDEDPREIACAIAAEVVKAASPEHNVVLFRRLYEKTVLYSSPLKVEHRTSFGLARV